jgi:Fic family protein
VLSTRRVDRSDFSKASRGSLVKNLEGHWTFVPDPLPFRLNWTDGLVDVVSRAEAGLGRLSGLGHKFPDPQRLVRMFLRREAELSSRIENTYAGVRTQLLFDVVPEVRERAPDAQEVDNNFRALELGLAVSAERGISQHLIRQVHQVLLRGVRGHDRTPGEYRKVQAHIGRSTRIDEARFVPPPPHLVPECMGHLERFMRDDKSVPRVARLAMAHYQFECIHPFADGNGRIGRVLILILMQQWGMLPLPLFNPSAYLENRRRAYYDHLLDVSTHGAWSDWIEFFAEGLVQESASAVARIEALESLRQAYQARVRTKGSPANLRKFVDELFARPRVTVDDVRRLFGTWPASAQRYIDRLVKMKILREVTGGKRGRVYLAQEIVDLFSTQADDR